jgi:signal transduction histidine kinase
MDPMSSPPSFPLPLLHAVSGGLAAMLLLMAALLFAVVLRHGCEGRARWLAAMMLCWLPLAAPLPAAWMGTLAFALVTLFGVHYLLRTLFAAASSIDAALGVQAVLAPLSVLLLNKTGLVVAWQGLMELELLAALGLAWWHGRRNSHIDTDDGNGEQALGRVLFFSAVPLLLLPTAARAAGLATVAAWCNLGLPVLMLALGALALNEVATARRAAELRTAEMERQLHERLAEAERNYLAMADARVEQVTERERKRIAADLHDDLGAKLLTIVHTSESDRISTLAREALEEMRLSVRGLTGKPVQLLDALGDWRAEVVSRLGQANILADWKSPSEDIIHTLPARAYVQTTRIVRESVSNIIKHSGATHCTVACHVQDGDFMLIIQDNGQGISAESDGRLDRGHGMSSMKSRAKQLQGQCLVESGPGWGTVIRLTIPLRP